MGVDNNGCREIGLKMVEITLFMGVKQKHLLILIYCNLLLGSIYLYMSQTFSLLSLMAIFFTIINLMNNQFMSVELGPNLEN